MASEMIQFEVTVAFLDETPIKTTTHMWDAKSAARMSAQTVWWKQQPQEGEPGGVRVKNLSTGEITFFTVEVEPNIDVTTCVVSEEELADLAFDEEDEDDDEPTMVINTVRIELPGVPTALAAPASLMLKIAELDLILEALESHDYWQLTDLNYRRDGYVMEPGTEDPEKLVMRVAIKELTEKLEALRPKEEVS